MLKYHKTILLCILVGSLAMRLLFAFWWENRVPEGQNFIFGDSATYWDLSKTIANGEPFVYQSTIPRKIMRTPGYPLLLAPLHLIGGDDVPVMWGRIYSAIFGTLAVYFVYWLGAFTFNKNTGLFAAAITAIYPEAIAASGFVLSETPFAIPMLLQLGFWIKSDNANRTRNAVFWAAMAGVAAGVAALIRPSWLLFVPFFAGLLLVFGAGRLRRGKLMAISVFCAAVVMSPWWIRNYNLMDKLVLTTLRTGASLYDGISPYADGSSDMTYCVNVESEFLREYYSRTEEERAKQPPFEYQLNKTFSKKAIDWAKEHPVTVVNLAVYKFLRMWRVGPNQRKMQAWYARLGVFLSYVPVMLLALYGTWKFRKQGALLVVLWMPAIYTTALHMVFVSSMRYRQPPMLSICIVSAAVLASWLERKEKVVSSETIPKVS